VEEILHQAEQLEKDYDWLGAAKLYGKALGLVAEKDFNRGQIHERLGYALYRAAFQAESSSDFQERMRQAIDDCGRVREFYEEMGESLNVGRRLRCDAMNAQMSYWLASSSQDKKKAAAESWTHLKASLEAFEESGDGLEYGRSFNQFSVCIELGFFFDWDFKVREKMIREALECGEKAIKFLLTVGNFVELSRAYVKTANFLETFGYYFVEPGDERDKYNEKAKGYVSKAIESSEEAAMIEVSSVLFGEGSGGYWGDGTDIAVRNLEKALEYGRKTRDRFIIGRTLDLLVYQTVWQSMAYEDPEESAKARKHGVQYAEEAHRQYSVISFVSPRGGGFWVESPFAHYYISQGYYETNPNNRRGFFEKALEVVPQELKKAESSGYPCIIYWEHELYGMALTRLARMITDPKKKKQLLEESLLHTNQASKTIKQADPLACWNLGLLMFNQATTKSELADLIEEDLVKKNMLQEAILEMKASLELCFKEIPRYDKEGSASAHALIGTWQYEIGNSSNRLRMVSHQNEHLREAIEAFDAAAESFQKCNLMNRKAECVWKSAQMLDTLGEHLKAAERFDLASNGYKSAAEKIPQLKGFYQDYASYMQAWDEIEKARYHHARQEYGSAKEHYRTAAKLHQSLRQWSYLAPNYSAWAEVEYAEELSRKEQSEDAIQAFEQAAKLFRATKESLRTQLNKIENEDEKKMATNLVQSTGLRSEYCVGRISLEQGKILDKRGDHYSSSEKFGTAAETFEKISQALESEQERKEFELIMTLSRAWQKMTLAEAEASSALYGEACELFEKAKGFSPNEKTKMLVLGNSRFCKALEAGTRFVDTRDNGAYVDAMKFLETASHYYIKAGFPKVSEYSEATKLLFDAYLQIDGATREIDPEKKAKLYAMAEKVLQTSAGSFMKAEHPEKREQVLGLLEKTKMERELAMSLTEVLHAPAIASTTNSFTTPTPTREEAVGSERFEHADIQANLIIRQKELKIGENLNIELELVNAGKGSALLTKVTEVIPEGFEVVEKPETYRVEDSYLNMKGKKLDPLKMEEVKLVLKPKVQGVFPLKPKILYLDENGKYKSHEPEPTTITVKELGIKGWLKGER